MISRPGVSRGTSTIDCCRCGGRLRVGLAHHDEDLAALVGRAGDPPLLAVDDVVVAVAADRWSGCSWRPTTRRRARSSRTPNGSRPPAAARATAAFCSGVPNRCSVSMLPVSGAWQLIASGAMTGDQPDTSATGGVLEVGQPGDAGQEQVPQPAAAGLGLQLLDDRRQLPLRPACRAARRGTPRRRPRPGAPLVEEGAHALGVVGGHGAGCEVHASQLNHNGRSARVLQLRQTCAIARN